MIGCFIGRPIMFCVLEVANYVGHVVDRGELGDAGGIIILTVATRRTLPGLKCRNRLACGNMSSRGFAAPVEERWFVYGGELRGQIIRGQEILRNEVVQESRQRILVARAAPATKAPLVEAVGRDGLFRVPQVSP